jgi:hypothetical protein
VLGTHDALLLISAFCLSSLSLGSSLSVAPRFSAQDSFIPQDRESGRPRGFAFVTMASGSDQAIQNLNETEFQVSSWTQNITEHA